MGCTLSKVAAATSSQQQPVASVPNTVTWNLDAQKDDSEMHLGVMNLTCDSVHSDDGYKYKMEVSITLPIKDSAIDRSEFKRKVDHNFIKKVNISIWDEKEVINCIKTFNSSLWLHSENLCLNGNGSLRQIAAQVKHSFMKSSSLSPQKIEAILSRLADKNGDSDDWPVTITYTDESDRYIKGVREFCFSLNKIT